MPGPALRFGFDLIRGDQFTGPISQAQRIGHDQGVDGDVSQSQHGHLPGRAVLQVSATFLGQGAVALAGQRMRMLKESIEHGRTSGITESAGGSTVTEKVMWRWIAWCVHA
jgi:hypothetical protein